MTEILELRRYSLHPGQRDVLIELFDREFVESQEALGMRVLGQFRDVADPDAFVWVRWFPDLATRGVALPGFYHGAVWRAHREAANATMASSDDVLLLRPTVPGRRFDLDPAVRDTPVASVVEVTVYYLTAPPDDAVVEFFDGTVLPLLELAGARSLALWQTEYAANNFPALPVREQVHVLVSFASFPDRDAVAAHHDRLAGLPAWTDDIQPRLPADVERFQLVPTNRSILR